MSLSKKSKIIIAVVVILAVAVTGGLLYIYKGHKTIDEMEVAFKGNSQDFLSKIEENADSWTKGEKVIELTGEITAKDVKGISINESIYFQLEEGTKTDNLSEGQKIKIKGRIVGYDDLLGELKLDKAIILKK
jgi:hypothetical protein